MYVGDLVAWSRLGSSYSPAELNTALENRTLPILYGDRLAGKLDATADRKAGLLQVQAIHQDVPCTKTVTAAIRREIKDLAHWLELDLTLPP